MQTGGHTIEPTTIKALGIDPEKAKDRIEKMKKSEGRPAGEHNHKIMDNGDVVDAKTGKVLGNLKND